MSGIILLRSSFIMNDHIFSRLIFFYAHYKSHSHYSNDESSFNEKSSLHFYNARAVFINEKI
jgi:hypothetical protein